MMCGHCGFTGDLDQKVSKAIRTEDICDQHGNPTGGEWSEVVEVLRCPSCSGLTLRLYDWSDFLDPQDVVVRVLYPQPRDASGLPPAVASEYAKAQRVRGIDPDYFAVGVRRTLEAICSDQGFPRTNKRDSLYARLQRLAQAGSLPSVFVGMADHLKDLGNLGAHPDDAAVDVEDVADADEFMEAILEYLYRAPRQVELVRTRLRERRNTRSEPTQS